MNLQSIDYKKLEINNILEIKYMILLSHFNNRLSLCQLGKHYGFTSDKSFQTPSTTAGSMLSLRQRARESW